MVIVSLYTVTILIGTPDSSRQYNTGFTDEFNILDSTRVWTLMTDHTY